MLPSVRIKLYAFRENISPRLHNTYDFITIKVICHVFFVKIFKNENFYISRSRSTIDFFAIVRYVISGSRNPNKANSGAASNIGTIVNR